MRKTIDPFTGEEAFIADEEDLPRVVAALYLDLESDDVRHRAMRLAVHFAQLCGSRIDNQSPPGTDWPQGTLTALVRASSMECARWVLELADQEPRPEGPVH